MFMSSGMCKSDEQAAIMATKMKEMSPEAMKVMVKLMALAQVAGQAAQKARAWLASRQVLVLALLVLFIAVILRLLGIM